jgi:hypothetical protein
VYIDGGNNLSTENGGCDGVFDLDADSCTEFTGPPTSSVSPTTTSAPSMSFQPSLSPSVHPTTIPTTTPTEEPSQSPTRSPSPSISVSPSMAPTTVVDSKCGEFEQDNREPCVQIENWNAFLQAIGNASNYLVLCSFDIMNDSGLAAVIEKDISILCPSHNCTIVGAGAHLRVRGDTYILISGLTFQGSEQSAVHVETSSRLATTSFCQCNFSK